ncbi:MAG: ACP S-malonyltransferase, partial [Phycisphaerales bacterium]|nr:ACP S-malonyltransferase [Phycisphaerales bacterium]
MSDTIVLCPGQGAQAVGMGHAWREQSPAAAATFAEADAVLGDRFGASLSSLCFEGPAERLNETLVSQPAIFTCSVACARALADGSSAPSYAAAAGLSLGEYTALHLAGVFDFADGLELVATRGRLMQQAADASQGGMVAVIGADEETATTLAADAAGDETLVPANFNAPGQIVLSGHRSACGRAVALAGERSLRATPLTVAGAFHSPLMQPAADAMAEVLAATALRPPSLPVWSNVTAAPHDPK